MKRILIFLLCLLVFTGSAGAEVYWPSPDSFAVAQEGAGASCGDSLTWTMEGSTLYITGSGEMYDFYSGAPWGSYKTSITRVVLSDGITYVGACAFQDYDALLGVEFGNSLVSIGKDAFYGCDGLTSVTLPATFKKFGENSFRSCSNLKEIHCSGGFPRFDDNCMWETYTTIYYSVSNPWPVSLIQQLEEAFHNRIEFRSSDGTDPYVPTQATEAPTTAPTVPTETFWVTEPTTQPVTQATVPTTAATIPVYTQPTTVATLPVQTLPPATEATIVLGSQPQTPPAYQPDSATDGSSIFGLLIVLIMLTILATGALIFRSASQSKRKKRRRYRR